MNDFNFVPPKSNKDNIQMEEIADTIIKEIQDEFPDQLIDNPSEVTEETIIEFEKEFKEEKKDNRSDYEKKMHNKEDNMSIDNIKIYEKLIDIVDYAIDNNTDILSSKKESYKYDIAILNETHFIKKQIGIHNKINYAVLFTVGTIFGMMYKTWLPYANILWELVKFSR